MLDKNTIIQHIRRAFGDNEYPGDAYLQGSFEGDEPYEVIAPFKGQTDWQQLEARDATLT